MQQFELVTAAHRFLLEAIPLGEVQSSPALVRFIRDIRALRIPGPLFRAVALEILGILATRLGILGRPSHAIQWYLEQSSETNDVFGPFEECVRRLYRQPTIRHPVVEKAIAFVAANYIDPNLSLPVTAHHAGCRPDYLCHLFRKHIGTTYGEFVRDARLSAASTLLINTGRSVKEVWASVGYMHASDFDHDFRKCFGTTPTQYRKQTTPFPLSLSDPIARTSSFEMNFRVILADDDETTRDIVGRYLRLAGLTVLTLANGESVLAEASGFCPDAVLLDFRLPDMDGLQCLRALRELPNCSDCCVLLFSADWELEMRAHEWRPLRAMFVSKLCDLDDVIGLLNRLLHGARQVSTADAQV